MSIRTPTTTRLAKETFRFIFAYPNYPMFTAVSPDALSVILSPLIAAKNKSLSLPPVSESFSVVELNNVLLFSRMLYSFKKTGLAMISGKPGELHF